MNPFRSFATGLVIVLGLFFFAQNTHAATTTICASGCDYTDLYTATLSDLPGPDGFLVMDGYVFDQGNEGGGNVTLPEETLLTCEPNVTIGNGEGSIILNSSNTSTVDSCRFDGVTLRAENVQNVAWNNNDFEIADRSEFHLFNVTDYRITNNESFSHVRMYNADNGLFEGNAFHCRTSVDVGIGCIASTYITIVPYDGSATTTNLIYNSNNVTVTNNVFSRTEGSVYAFMDLFGGADFTITENEFLSLTVSDASITALRFFDTTGMNVTSNTFDIILPDNTGSGGGEAVQVIGENYLDTTIEHNTIIFRGVDSPTYNICFRVDKYGAVDPSRKVTIAYNLCTATDSVIDNGFYIQNEVLLDNQLDENYNAFYPVDDVLYIIGTGGTSSHPGTHGDIKPIFRNENADPNDDLELNSASPLLDVNGINDIGRFPGTRISTYTIDDDCIVDYVTCVTQFSQNLQHLFLSDDSVLLAAGTYGPITTQRELSGVSILGAGATTIIDGQTAKTAFNIANADQWTVENLKVINSTASSTGSFIITNTIFAYNGNDYDDSDAIGQPANGTVVVNSGVTCIDGIVLNDGDPIGIIDGTSNINGALVNIGGFYLSFLLIGNSICGGAAPIEVLVQDMFIADGVGGYTFNPASLTNAGVTLKAGMTMPPNLVGSFSSTDDAGIRLDNVTNSEFNNIIFEDNTVGIAFVGDSADNVFTNADLWANNSVIDVLSGASGINDLLNSAFSRAKSSVTGNGGVRARFDVNIRVVDSLMLPLAGVTVHKTSENGLEDSTEVTDIAGLTSMQETITFIMNSSSIDVTAGDYNPYTVVAEAQGQNAETTRLISFSTTGTVDLVMDTVPVTPVSPGGGIGGLTTVNNDGTYPPLESIRSTEVITTPKVHYLIKLVDDNDPATQEDSSIYYIAADGMRHVFPNESVYLSWYCDYSEVRAMSLDDISKYTIGSNVTYRPGLRMIKFIASPIVYMIQSGRTLRPIHDEATAAKIFGKNWAKQITDVEETFFNDYTIGETVYDYVDPHHLDYAPKHPSGEMGIKNYKNIFVQPASLNCR